MLSQAKALCISLLGPSWNTRSPYFDPTPGHGYLDAKLTGLNESLIPDNGDAELWLSLCSLANTPPVHVLTFAGPITSLTAPPIQNTEGVFTIAPSALIAPQNYPLGAPVGNEQAMTVPYAATGNRWPWCVADTLAGQVASAAQEGYLDDNHIPRCPQQSVDALTACVQTSTSCFGIDDANKWAVRGAINAGMAVFTYVRSIENSAPLPDYDQCTLLK